MNTANTDYNISRTSQCGLLGQRMILWNAQAAVQGIVLWWARTRRSIVGMWVLPHLSVVFFMALPGAQHGEPRALCLLSRAIFPLPGTAVPHDDGLVVTRLLSSPLHVPSINSDVVLTPIPHWRNSGVYAYASSPPKSVWIVLLSAAVVNAIYTLYWGAWSLLWDCRMSRRLDIDPLTFPWWVLCQPYPTSPNRIKRHQIEPSQNITTQNINET